jgi:hypothetical protein
VAAVSENVPSVPANAAQNPPQPMPVEAEVMTPPPGGDAPTVKGCYGNQGYGGYNNYYPNNNYQYNNGYGGYNNGYGGYNNGYNNGYNSGFPFANRRFRRSVPLNAEQAPLEPMPVAAVLENVPSVPANAAQNPPQPMPLEAEVMTPPPGGDAPTVKGCYGNQGYGGYNNGYGGYNNGYGGYNNGYGGYNNGYNNGYNSGFPFANRRFRR